MQVSPSQLSRSDMEKVCVLVAYYGGRMQQRLDATVTHLITVETTGVRERHVCLSHSGKDSRPRWTPEQL